MKISLKNILQLYFIMGSNNTKEEPINVLQQAIDGGVTLFQFREKGKDARIGKEKRELAEKMQRICRDARVPFIVNDDVELAIELDADGVHVGQDDEGARIVREKIGPDKILGVSTHTIEEALQAIEDGADYLGLGPIYPTTSKNDAKEAQDVALIQQFRQKGITIPIVGIGGITVENAKDVILAGADGISVISAIAGAENVKETAKQLRDLTMTKS